MEGSYREIRASAARVWVNVELWLRRLCLCSMSRNEVVARGVFCILVTGVLGCIISGT